MSLSPAAGIAWFMIALFATAAQYQILPVAGTDQSISALVIVGGVALLVAPVAGMVFSALWEKIAARLPGNWLGCLARIPMAAFYLGVMLAVVGSPLVYFFFVTKKEFDSYPVSRELPVEKAAAERGCNASPVFALISDTHITDRPATLEKKTGGDGKLRRVLKAIRDVCPKLLVVSGDLTDQGERPEWERWRALLHESDAVPQPVFVPGNHDLQGTPYNQGEEVLTKGFARTQDEYLYSVRYLERKRNFLDLARTEGLLTRAAVDSSMPAEFSRRVDEVLAAAAKKERIMTDSGDMGGGVGRTKPSFAFQYPPGFGPMLEAAQKRFDELFPMVYQDARDGLTLVLLDSSAHLSPGASMGLGSLGADQMKRLEKFLSGFGAAGTPRSLVVVLHHAPLRRATDRWSWRELRQKLGDSAIWAHTVLALDVNDARKLDSLMDHFARSHPETQVVLIHGHRHGPAYLGQSEGGVLIVEAPSTVEDYPPGYWAAYRVGGKLAFKWRSAGP